MAAPHVVSQLSIMHPASIQVGVMAKILSAKDYTRAQLKQESDY